MVDLSIAMLVITWGYIPLISHWITIKSHWIPLSFGTHLSHSGLPSLYRLPFSKLRHQQLQRCLPGALAADLLGEIAGAWGRGSVTLVQQGAKIYHENQYQQWWACKDLGVDFIWFYPPEISWICIFMTYIELKLHPKLHTHVGNFCGTWMIWEMVKLWRFGMLLSTFKVSTPLLYQYATAAHWRTCRESLPCSPRFAWPQSTWGSR